MCLSQTTAFIRTVNPDATGRVSVSFASCIDIEPNPIWQEMKTLQPDAIFLMGTRLH